MVRGLEPFGVSGGRPTGPFRPGSGLLRGPAAGWFRVVIHDRLTPALEAANGAVGPMIATGMQALRAKMESNIKERFRNGPSVWAPLKPSTVRWKASHGIPWPNWTLRETLTLASNVERLRVNLRLNRARGGGGITGTGIASATLEIPASTFWGSPYVAYHEMGWGQTRRGFIQEGILDSYREYQQALTGTAAKLWQILQNPKEHGVPSKDWMAGFNIIPFAGMPLRAFAIGLIMPPTSLWSIVGAMSDIRSLVEGEFTPGMIMAWLRNWALGSVGLTAKTQRRRLRRQLWRLS